MLAEVLLFAAMASCVINQTASVNPSSLSTKVNALSAARIVAFAIWDTSAPAVIRPTTSFHASTSEGFQV